VVDADSEVAEDAVVVLFIGEEGSADVMEFVPPPPQALSVSIRAADDVVEKSN
jgi:hypothetical protein